MLRSRPSCLHGYILAVGLVEAALLAALALAPFTAGPLFELFVLAVVLSAWYGGIGPGVVSTLLASIGADYYFIPPIHSLHIYLTTDVVRLVVFVLVATITSSLAAARHQALQDLQALNAELEGRVEERTAQLTETNRSLEAEIAQRKRAEAEKGQVIAQLENALANVKTLSGLLPICAWCTKIRDDQGYWRELEAYLEAHTETTVSHGICPDCAKQFRREFP